MLTSTNSFIKRLVPNFVGVNKIGLKKVGFKIQAMEIE
nr:MAG TPA: Udp N-acetylglucosamine O-acyltransferase 2 [Caudoviricetes sp.]